MTADGRKREEEERKRQAAAEAERKRKDEEERLRRERERKEEEIAEHIRLGNETLGKGQFDAAIEHFRKAIALEPSRSSEVHDSLAIAGAMT